MVTASANTWHLVLQGDKNVPFSALVESRSETVMLTLDSGDDSAILTPEPLDLSALVMLCDSAASNFLRACHRLSMTVCQNIVDPCGC